MGGVSVDSGGGGGGRKSVDANINMVPMIDLLVSCIAFLLMTAVWVQTGALQAAQPRGAPTPDQPPPPDQPDQLKIQISRSALRVGLTASDTRDVQAGPRKLDELRQILGERHRTNAQQREVWVQPDSDVTYNDIVEVMDVVYEVWGEGRAPGQNVRDMVTIRFL
jgi:biopolymer transport protein ExbD